MTGRRGRSPLWREVYRTLHGAVPPLHQRLRIAALEELATRVAAREDSSAFRHELNPAERLASTALHLRRVLFELQHARESSDEDFSRFVSRLGRTDDPAARSRTLAAYLRAQAPNWWARLHDLRALRRSLDLDTLRERHCRRQRDLLRVEEVATLAIQGTLAGIVGEPDADRERATRLVADSDLPLVVADIVLGHEVWRFRLAAATTLRTMAVLGIKADTATVGALAQRCNDAREQPFVVGQIVGALLRLDPLRGIRVVEHRLLAPRLDVRHDFLARRTIVNALATAPATAQRLLLRVWEANDPSDHVRIGLSAALAACPTLGLEGLSALAKSCRPPPAGVESNPTVRAASIRALASAAAAHAESRAGTDTPDLLAVFADTASDVLRYESDEATVRQTCRWVAQLTDPDRSPTSAAREAVASIAATAAFVAAAPERSTATQEHAAWLRESLTMWSDDDLRDVWREVRHVVRSVEPGRARVVRDSNLTRLDQDALGRAMALEARDGFGLDVSPGPRNWVVRRGDRLGLRLWRILHEARNRGPNKRQGHRHTVGRRLHGTMRSHSGQLHEATATTVPGERVTIAREGGWGRHLPLVDDVVGLPLLSSEPVRIFSSHGITTLTSPATLWGRLRCRLRLATSYGPLDRLRRRALATEDLDERRQYVDALSQRLGVTTEFVSHPTRLEDGTEDAPGDTGSQRVKALFGGRILALAPVPLPVDSWLRLHWHYFLSPGGNAQTSLAYFGAGLLAVFALGSYLRRARLRHARNAIGLSIGGWGTRGKSGTERLKAGFLHGLGFDVFSKTTGCESMFLHSVPGGGLAEIFVFRPYEKATIWEQMTLLGLADQLGADVFLWECMALKPDYVEILQSGWMRDDFATITNAYPDHEDIQGPTGLDVASVIARFVPRQSTLITSETNFLPLLREQCRVRQTRCVALDEGEDALLAADLLDLFPYDEHPRNIALVSALAAELGVDRELAIVLMAEHVVADLGVLKTYPKTRVRGRLLSFTNGCSANERTGFMTSWHRSGFDEDLDEHPQRFVMTVVNNRADRISRSEVFARILVQDIAADRHVLIGTNLGGLVRYINVALTEVLEDLSIVKASELGTPDGFDRTHARLRSTLARVRVSLAGPERVLQQLGAMVRGVGRSFVPSPELDEALRSWLADDPAASIEIDVVRRAVDGDGRLARGLASSMREPLVNLVDAFPEVLQPPAIEAVARHAADAVARAAIGIRLCSRLRSVHAAGASQIDAFHADVRLAYEALFRASLIVVEDPKTSGDALVERCADSAPPGFDVRIMGMQNIKGTGLDFVYRWLAVGTIDAQIRKFGRETEPGRARALAELERFSDHGAMGLGMLREFCANAPRHNEAEAETLERINDKVRRHSAAARGEIAVARKATWPERVAASLEHWLDFLDSMFRYHRSRRIARDLASMRISHAQAAVQMRHLVAREKGGWLVDWIRRRSR